MTDQTPPRLPTAGFPTRPLYDDRKTLLTVVGALVVACAILMYVGGLIYAVVFPLMMRAVPADEFGPGAWPFSTAMMLGYAVFMFAYGTAMTVLGIGLIRARRWARAVSLAACWVYAAGTLVGVCYLPFWMGRVTSFMTDPALGGDPSLEGMSPVFFSVVMWGSMVFGLAMNLAVPVAGILLLRSESVRLTVQDRDPFPRWTDRLSTAALASGLVWVGGASYGPLMLALLGTHMAAAVGLSGGTGVALCLFASAGAALIGWATLRARPYSWMANVMGVVLYGGIGAYLVSRLDFTQFYRALMPDNMPEEELASLYDMTEALYGNPSAFIAPTLLITLAALGFLCWARPRFVPVSGSGRG
ncbi:MAG: hypothetical protein R3E97_14850 [Candidatus Eisenbacteria bacterium]